MRPLHRLSRGLACPSLTTRFGRRRAQSADPPGRVGIPCRTGPVGAPGRCRIDRALGASLFLVLAGCGGTEIPESTLRATIEKRSFGIDRDRAWVLATIEGGYSDRRTHLWFEGDELSVRGQELLAALEGSAAEGLDPEAYGVTLIRGALDTLPAIPASDSVGRTRALADLEIRLSLGLLSLSRDLLLGRLDPHEARQDWRIPPDSLPRELLKRVREGEELHALLDSLRPKVPYYGRLVEALAKLREVESRGGWGGVSLEPGVRVGRRAEGVTTLRARLTASEDALERRLASVGGDSNVYDADLAGAVTHYQSRHGIEPDGAPGAATLRELRTPVEARIDAIRLNLDRLRWLPRDLGDTAILVNVAGFEFVLLEGHEPRMNMSVIVGRARWATRLFSARMDHLVLNPYWNVPQSILANEILPTASRDPAYLSRNGFEVSGGGGPSAGDGSAPASQWSGVRVRQRPGPRNALGRVKFMFPNPYDIYLHDTPDDHLFSRAYRAFSHGCIRLERPLELARHIVEHHTDRAATEVDGIVESGRTVSIELSRPIDVYVAYLTAWVDDGGTIHFHRDIYGRDGELREVATSGASLAKVERSIYDGPARTPEATAMHGQ